MKKFFIIELDDIYINNTASYCIYISDLSLELIKTINYLYNDKLEINKDYCNDNYLFVIETNNLLIEDILLNNGYCEKLIS